jgi:hypothetical protein
MMKKILILTLVAILASSCSSLLGQTPAPNVDAQATIDAIVRKSKAQTQAAQPSPTTVLPTDTATPLVVSSPTTQATDAPSSIPAPNLTTTPVTATAGTLNPTLTAGTATQALSASGSPTLTPTLGILKYGTLPPAVPYAIIKIFNKSKAQAYISLQNDAIGRSDTVLEFPVKKEVRTKAPLGYYVCVVWVGGRQIVDEFVLNKDDDITITIFKDKITIQ